MKEEKDLEDFSKSLAELEAIKELEEKVGLTWEDEEKDYEKIEEIINKYGYDAKGKKYFFLLEKFQLSEDCEHGSVKLTKVFMEVFEYFKNKYGNEAGGGYLNVIIARIFLQKKGFYFLPNYELIDIPLKTLEKQKPKEYIELEQSLVRLSSIPVVFENPFKKNLTKS